MNGKVPTYLYAHVPLLVAGGMGMSKQKASSRSQRQMGRTNSPDLWRRGHLASGHLPDVSSMLFERARLRSGSCGRLPDVEGELLDEAPQMKEGLCSGKERRQAVA